MAALSDVIQQYVADQRARGYAYSTIRRKQSVLTALLADIGNIQTRSMRPEHMDRFWAHDRGWAPGTLNGAADVFSTFFKWCQTRGHISRDMDLLEGQRRLRVPPRDRVLIPQSEFSTLLASLEPRPRAVFALGLYSFMRVSEITGLRWRDINFKNGTMEVFREKTTTLDTLPICAELHDELRRWRMTYGAVVGDTPLPQWYVIPALTQPRSYGTRGAKGFQFQDKSDWLPEKRARLNHTVRETLIKLGYYRPHEGCHTLRRSGATALYDQLSSVGHDRAIRICQAMLGHSNITTTEVYLRLDLDRKTRNDLLAGQPMFPDTEGHVIELGVEGVTDGQANV